MSNPDRPPEGPGPQPAEPSAASRYQIAALLNASAITGLAIIGAAVLCIVAGFAFAAGWFSPHKLTQGRIIAAFVSANGAHPGFRYNHAKGVCVTGSFDSNGNGAALSRAVVFRPGRTPVFGRFALAGGHPAMADGPKAVRSMALNFTLSDGEIWRTGMNDIPVFPVRTARGFYEQLLALTPDSKTGKPDPARMKAFLASHPETVRAHAVISAHPFSSDFANAAYNSLDAFRFIDAAGASHAVRWAMEPEDAFAPDDRATADKEKPNYLFDALIARFRRGPVRWRLVITVAKAGDPTNDATLAWPADREHVNAGVLTLTAISDEAHGDCRDINFDPLALPAGIAPSDDPLLSARSSAYARSFTLREGEKKTPSAVQIPIPAKGT